MKKEIKNIPVESIEFNDNNPRRNTKPTSEMIKSIKVNGVKVPVIVTNALKGGTKYLLVAGTRRINACKAAGVKTVDAVIIEGTEAEIFETTIIENAFREDLTIPEQVDQVNTLLKLNSNKIEIVASKLNITVPQVRRTLLINKLIPGIKRSMTDDESAWSHMSIDMLGLIAALPISQQKSIEGSPWKLNDLNSAKALKSWINNTFRFDLTSAKWNIEDDALSGEPACTKCKKQSANNQQQLFEEDKTSKSGICNDPDCWHRKTRAYIANCIADQLKIDAKTMIIDSNGLFDNKYSHFLDGHYTSSSKGTINVMQIGSDGTFKKYKVSAEKGAKKIKTASGGTRTMTERKEPIEGLRMGILCEALKKHIDTKEARDHAVTKHSLKELAALSICFKQGTVVFKSENRKIYSVLCKDKSVAFSVGYQDMHSYTESVIGLLWYSTKDDLITALSYHNSDSALANKPVAEFIAEYTGFDWKAAWKKAIEEKPDPKSWVNLNADGTKKEIAKTPKKVKVADCDKCRKPHTNDCATCSATTGVPKKRKSKPQLKKREISK